MSYVIAGRAIKNEYLALGTMVGTAAIAMLASGGDKEAPVPVKESKTIEAGSKDEEDFIKQFVAEAEKESKPAH